MRVTQIFPLFFRICYFFVYRHSDLEGLCSNGTKIRHVNLVVTCGPYRVTRSDIGLHDLKHLRKGNSWFLDLEYFRQLDFCGTEGTSSWWWVSTPESCRGDYRYILIGIQSHHVGQLLDLIQDARTHEYNKRFKIFKKSA